ncbi:tail fiber domain-containing protein [Pedobacter glucosidilyticus]|uniref:tail fiber domain-containing protein n=1 Tax=Pedobacter glucosidilyticus TaxID=1122941 RepID=UPI0004028C1A|nr:DNA topoisomerase IV [Pedobacter glucosidilyticus]
MKTSFILKTAIIGVFATVLTLNVQAQKIEESDLKVDITKITNPTEKLNALEPITFKYDVDKYKYLRLPSGNQYGFKTNGVNTQLPGIVTETSKMYPAGKNQSKVAKYEEVQMNNLIPVLVAAVKEQQTEIELLKKEIERLKVKSAQLID